MQTLAIDRPDRLLSCVLNNTWTTTDEYIRRVQSSRMRIARSYGPEAYVEFSSLWTCGPLQFRYAWEELQSLEARQKQTIAPVDVLVNRLQMSLDHDRTSELHKITTQTLVVGTKDDTTVPSYFAEDLHKARHRARNQRHDDKPVKRKAEMRVRIVDPDKETVLVPDHLEPRKVKPRGKSYQEKGQSAAKELRFQPASQAEKRKIQRSARDLRERESQLPAARDEPVHQDCQDHHGKDKPAQIRPERQIEKIERNRFAENRVRETLYVL